MPKHEFFVDMTCEGCSNAVTRVLQRLGGESKETEAVKKFWCKKQICGKPAFVCTSAGVQFDIDLPNKKVCIDSEHSIDTLLETLKKTGKNASYLGEKSTQ